jgi:membrane-associated phospholipid phosphatase
MPKAKCLTKTGYVRKTSMQWLQGLDTGAYYFFRNMPGTLSPLQGLLRIVDALGSVPVMAVVLAGVVAILWVRGERRFAVVILAISLCGFILVEGLSWVLFAAGAGNRPPEPDEAFLAVVHSPGFPSRTVFLTALGYGLLAHVLGGYCPGWKSRWGIYGLFLLLVLLHGFSQLFFRVHSLTDLISGWAAGVMALLLCFRLGFRKTT